MASNNERKVSNNIISLYLICSLSFIILFFIIFLFNHRVFTWLVMEHNFKYTFSDYFRQLIYSKDLKNIYFNTTDAPFPPLAYCIFHIINKISPIRGIVTKYAFKITAINKLSFTIFFGINIFFIIALYVIIIKILNKEKWYTNLLLLTSLLLSAPFLAGTLERGNPIFAVLIFLLYAIYYRNSNSKILRELSLILLALASAFKVYPVIYSILYIKEKRYKEFFKFCIYFLILFFVPYVFTGGIKGMESHLIILAGFQCQLLGVVRWTSIRCFYFSSLHLFGIENSIYHNFIVMFLEVTFLFLMFDSFYKSTKDWKKLLYLSGICICYVNNSFRYTAIYMAIPLLFMFKDILENNKVNKFTYVYTILFALIFTIQIYGINLEVDFLIFVTIYILLAVSIIEDKFLLKEKRS